MSLPSLVRPHDLVDFLELVELNSESQPRFFNPVRSHPENGKTGGSFAGQCTFPLIISVSLQSMKMQE